jgi:hypothetical protein
MAQSLTSVAPQIALADRTDQLESRRSHGCSLREDEHGREPSTHSNLDETPARDGFMVADASPARGENHARHGVRKYATGDASAGPRRAGQASATLPGVALAPTRSLRGSRLRPP